MSNINDIALEDLVDELGAVRVKLQELRDRETQLTAILARSGQTHVQGAFWEVDVVTVGPFVEVDWKAVARCLNPSRQMIQAHSKTREPYVQIRAFPRPGYGHE